MDITHKTHYVNDGKRIDTFDGLFPLAFRNNAYFLCKTANYNIGWNDTHFLERASYDYFLHSLMPYETLDKLGLFDCVDRYEPARELIDGMNPEKAVINLSVSSDANFVHHHHQKKIMLYYANPEWADGWGGETTYWSEDLKEIGFTSPYTPGRLIIFDGLIPHSIKPQSSIAPKYRFSLAVVMN